MLADTLSPPAVHPHDGRPPPRWAVRATHLIPLVVLPSGLWRIALVAGLPIGAVVAGVRSGPGSARASTSSRSASSRRGWRCSRWAWSARGARCSPAGSRASVAGGCRRHRRTPHAHPTPDTFAP